MMKSYLLRAILILLFFFLTKISCVDDDKKDNKGLLEHKLYEVGHFINAELKKRGQKGIETNWLYHIYKGAVIEEWPREVDI